MVSGSRHRGSDLFPIAALAADALAGPLSALGHALREEGRSALRAGLGDRSRPGDEFALGVLVARVERLAALASPFHELAPAAGLGAHDAEGDGLGGLALGIAGARDELAEATMLDHPGLRAGRARFVGELVGGLLPAAEVFRVLAVGIAGAREELAEATPLLDHGLAAIRTGLAGLLADLVVR